MHAVAQMILKVQSSHVIVDRLRQGRQIVFSKSVCQNWKNVTMYSENMNV